MTQISLESIKRIDKNRNTIHEKVILPIQFSKKMEKSSCSWILMAVSIEKTPRK